jgi:tetratricopeptide (TPR) repeat protein
VTSRAKVALALFALVALVALVYAPVRRGVFVWDDHALVETNPLVQKGAVVDIFRQPFWTTDALSDARPAYYRPLAILSLRADFALAGDEAAAFHLSNLLLHLLAMILLAVAAQRLGASGPASVLAGGVWALLPRSTESVAWIAGRTDVLAAVMVLGALAMWPWYGDAEPAPPSSARSARLRALIAGMLVLLGLLSKEVAVAAVVAIAAGTSAGASGAGRARWALVARRLAYVAAPLAAYVVVRLLATHGAASRVNALGPGMRAATVLEAVGRYAEMILDPWHSKTSIGLMGELDRARALAGALVVLCGVAVILALRARRRPAGARDAVRADTTTRVAETASLATAAGLGLGSLAPVLHIVPVVIAASVAADRLLYLPLAGLALGLAVASARLSPRARRVAGVAAVALGASFVPATHARAEDYTDEVRFRVVAAENAHPRNTSAKSGLANVLRSDAEIDLACRLHASVRRSLERSGRAGTPRHLRAMENLGSCYALLGDYARAATVYGALEELNPRGARVQMELGYLHLHQLAVDEAEVAFQRALALDPALVPAQRTLALLPTLRVNLAIFATEEARRADPVGWAHVLLDLGRVPDAIAAWSALLDGAALPEGEAWEALEFLLASAEFPTARRAAERYFERGHALRVIARQRLEARTREQARIERLRARIEALAAD